MEKYIWELIEKIESYKFECQAGPLKNCVDWDKLKEKHRHYHNGTGEDSDTCVTCGDNFRADCHIRSKF